MINLWNFSLILKNKLIHNCIRIVGSGGSLGQETASSHGLGAGGGGSNEEALASNNALGSGGRDEEGLVVVEEVLVDDDAVTSKLTKQSKILGNGRSSRDDELLFDPDSLIGKTSTQKALQSTVTTRK